LDRDISWRILPAPFKIFLVEPRTTLFQVGARTFIFKAKK